jgi:ArsR family metal-binding transcriptional regulator
MSRHLLCGFHMRLGTPDCSPGSAHYRVVLDLENDITEVLPYLNAELEGAQYDHDTKILLWDKDNKKVAFRAFEIALAPVADREEGERLAAQITDTVNDIWERRDQIKPKFEGSRPLPRVLDIFKLLPRTNCRECGFLSCMAFATTLRSDPSKRSLCPHISESDFIQLWK